MSTCSVAMATYNGAVYLEAQLRSIATQARPPDEVVIADDGSTDGTLDIVRRVAADMPCPVVVVEGGGRLGPVGNFERALRNVTTEVVFLCDQDDLWHQEKVAILMERFERDAAVGGIFSDGLIVSDDQALRDRSLWDTVGFTPDEQRSFSADPLQVLLRRNVVTGASLAFRSALLALVLPFPYGGWHDLSIAILIASTSTLELCDRRLISYRLHQANAAGLATGSRRSQMLDRPAHLANLDAQQLHWSSLRARMAKFHASADVLIRVDEKLAHLARRRALPRRRLARVGPAIGELVSGRYTTYAAGPWSLVRDVVGP